MSTIAPAMRHVRGFDVVRPLSIGMLVFMMLPLVFLPLASIFIFGTSNGLDKFWAALMAPEAIFALKLSMATSFWATVFNVIFGLFAAYVLSRYNFWGRNVFVEGYRWMLAENCGPGYHDLDRRVCLFHQERFEFVSNQRVAVAELESCARFTR